MNKFGVILGVAAVATLAGCKDPDYVHKGDKPSQREVKNVETTPMPAPVVTDVKPVVTPKCTCLPGTKHTEPCKCGAPDCTCIVETKPVIVADVSKPAEPAYTIYIVQSGDYLAKISKKFNVTISSIKRLNPSIKKDIVFVGQKLKLPGKIDVGVQTAPVKAVAAKPVAKKASSAAPYAGATKEYVVKNGDTLGSIAYGNGINIRQLKALNNLTSDSLKIGQKLKIPAEKVAKKSAKSVNPAAAEMKPEEKPAEKPEEKTEAPADTAVEPAPAEAGAAEPVPEKTESATATSAAEPVATPATDAKEAKPATMTYVVGEGEDMTAVCIRWNVTAAEIRELNNLAEGAQLTPGQIIKLPADAQQ